MKPTTGLTHAKIFLSVFTAIIAAAAVIFGAERLIAKWKDVAHQHELAAKAEEANSDFLHDSSRDAGDPSTSNEALVRLVAQTGHAKDVETQRRRNLVSSGVATTKELEACDHFQKEADALTEKIKERLAEQEKAEVAQTESQNSVAPDQVAVAEEPKKEAKSRVAPDGVVYNLNPIRVIASNKPLTIAPGADLKVIRKNEDGTMTLEYDTVVLTLSADDVTNDRTALWKHLEVSLK